MQAYGCVYALVSLMQAGSRGWFMIVFVLITSM
jgi:hypothetical protein